MTEPDLLGPRADSGLLGPHSLHWRYAGDNRLMLVQVKTALLQLMHPGLGAAVAQHSRFFSASFAGLTAAIPAIQGVTFDWPDGQATALGIRDRHWKVKGVDEHGDRYHALNPDTYFWGHATMFDMLITAIDLFDHPLTDVEKERLYQESLAHYELYGVSTRTVPRSWPAFAEYFDTVCADELDLTTAAAAMLTFRDAPPELSGALAKPASVLAGKPLGRLMWWIGLGTLHPAVQERIGLDWTAAEAERLARLGRAIGHGWPVLPPRLRYSKRARTGMHRVRSAAG